MNQRTISKSLDDNLFILLILVKQIAVPEKSIPVASTPTVVEEPQKPSQPAPSSDKKNEKAKASNENKKDKKKANKENKAPKAPAGSL